MKKERNYGIDLLRIVAMFFVLLLHSLGQGGILKNIAVNSVQYKACWFIEIFAYCAVDIFALISGYVSYNKEEKKTKYSNYLNIWLQVVFYGLLVTGLFKFIKPEFVKNEDFYKVLLPVTNGLYWYFTAYTGLFAIMPFLNKGIAKCNEKTLKKLFVVIILVFSFWDIIGNRFVLLNGYSFIWIALLYIIGAIIRKCEIGKNMKIYHALVGIVLFSVIAYLYKIYGIEKNILNIKIDRNLLVSYTSPMVLGSAILYIIAFSKMKFNETLKKVIGFFAPATFSIYILNNHAMIWNHVMKNLFVKLANQSVGKIFIFVFGFSLIFVIGAMLIDKIRIYLFKICRIRKITCKVEEILNKIITKISNFI